MAHSYPPANLPPATCGQAGSSGCYCYGLIPIKSGSPLKTATLRETQGIAPQCPGNAYSFTHWGFWVLDFWCTSHFNLEVGKWAIAIISIGSIVYIAEGLHQCTYRIIALPMVGGRFYVFFQLLPTKPHCMTLLHLGLFLKKHRPHKQMFRGMPDSNYFLHSNEPHRPTSRFHQRAQS